MFIKGFAPAGYTGQIVDVEVDIRRGIPCVEIIGLPDSAVREARERVRISIQNSGFSFPRERIFVNLAPADVRKEGASFDLPIAISLMLKSGLCLPVFDSPFMILGELQLSGAVRPVRGVLSAVASGIEQGIKYYMVPTDNIAEAKALGVGNVWGVQSLSHAADLLSGAQQYAGAQNVCPEQTSKEEDYEDLKGQAHLKLALKVAAAGRHHLLVFGPPGSGKTMAARRFSSLLPDLSRTESIEVSRIHSLAGMSLPRLGLMHKPPFRSPHHSASNEGMVGGGKGLCPGEVSLAHSGVLYLDEAPEFRKNLLQGLREPIESGRIDVVRAGRSVWYPADFQLFLSANPCPCGNMGSDASVCVCSKLEILGYWKRLGGALLDRIDIRIPVKPISVAEMLLPADTCSAQMKIQVGNAREKQIERFAEQAPYLNGRIHPGKICDICRLSPALQSDFAKAVMSLSLSSRACHSILKVARTCADLDSSEEIEKEHLFTAIQLRRYADEDFFWFS